MKTVYVIAAAFLAAGAGAHADVIVERVTARFAGAEAGLQAGDRISRWQAGDASGPVQNPFEFSEIEAAHYSPDAVELTGDRGGEPLSVELQGGEWRVEVRPVFGEDELSAYGDSDLRPQLALALTETGRPAAAAWVYRAMAGDAADQADWELAEAHFRAATLAAGEDAELLAGVAESRARLYERHPDSAAAVAAWELAIEARPRNSLLRASAQLHAANLTRRTRDLAWATGLLDEALETATVHAPGGLLHARILRFQGIVAAIRGRTDEAESLMRRSLAALGPYASDSLDASAVYVNLGNLLRRRGLYAEAQAALERGLALNQHFLPDGAEVAIALNNLGIVLKERGALVAAEAAYTQSLAIKRRSPQPDGLPEAITLGNLGNIALARGDAETAKLRHAEALERFERIRPDSELVARAMSSLGQIELDHGDLAQAEAWFEKAAAVNRRARPNSLGEAVTIDLLGVVAMRAGQYDLARERFEQALALRESIAPLGRDMAASHVNLADLARQLGRRDIEENHLDIALRLQARLAPASSAYAETLAAHARLLRERGDNDNAARQYAASIAALESQGVQLGGSDELRARFADRYGPIFIEYIDLLLDGGAPAEAFAVLERYRARSLLAMLADRDLALVRGLPRELVERRAQLNRTWERTVTELAGLQDSAEDAARIDAALARLDELTREREKISAQLREIDPRASDAERPDLLGIEEARNLLAPGTGMLSYAVSAGSTTIFVVSSDALEVEQVPAGDEELARRIDTLRVLIRLPDAGPDSDAALVANAHALYRTLVEPVRPHLAGVDNLLIVPDGPLHLLPFAALVSEPGTIDESRFLVEDFSLGTTLSATVHARLGSAATGAAAPPQLVAFGDPAPRTEETDWLGGLHTMALRSDHGPLPFARREILAIAESLPAAADVFLGDEATETRAKSLPGGPRIVHFATHGVLDERFPLNSYLLLAPDPATGSEDGLLQAWEIFEQVRLDAELVTLSACDTGLGAESGAEGLIGLARAFQYAGARAVLASLWSVSDASTSRLMERFYEDFGAGLPKAQALRNAQLDMLLGRASFGERASAFFSGEDLDYRHPFHWASFRLIGNADPVPLP